jgi:hypothetical protein
VKPTKVIFDLFSPVSGEVIEINKGYQRAMREPFRSFEEFTSGYETRHKVGI